MATTQATAVTLLTIEIIDIEKLPKLFAPAVGHGAEVLFLNNLGVDYVVEFEDSSPLHGNSKFTVAKEEKKMVRASAENKTYRFQITTPGSLPVHLWLTVEADGIEKVGFDAQPPSGIATSADVHTQLWAPAGDLEIQFANRTDDSANLVISEYPDNPIPVTARQTDAFVSIPFFENRIVQLVGSRLFDESGGTETVDILIEDP